MISTASQHSMKDPTPGWRIGWLLTGFLMTNYDRKDQHQSSIVCAKIDMVVLDGITDDQS